MSTPCTRQLISTDEILLICEAEEILSYSNFLKTKNSFHAHFYRNFTGRIYRTQSAYKKCYKASEYFRKLAAQLKKRNDYYSADFLFKLYEAYKLMRPYAASNWEMFK